VSRITLKPGDLVVWDPEQEGYGQATMLVSKDGEELLFQFGTKPFSHMQIRYRDGRRGPGLNVPEAVLAIDIGVYPYAFPGFIYKSYDAETGESYSDPLEL